MSELGNASKYPVLAGQDSKPNGRPRTHPYYGTNTGGWVAAMGGGKILHVNVYNMDTKSSLLGHGMQGRQHDVKHHGSSLGRQARPLC